MIAVDWGTSSLRAYRVSKQEEVVERREAPLGIMQVDDGDFARALESQIGDWLSAGETPIVMSGMIGSRQGWCEAPYVPTPAGLADISTAMVRVAWKRYAAWIAPGVSTRSPTGIADVMRGEETQLLGVIDALPTDPCWVCMPGTHSKWVRVAGGTIETFRTHMTGEVFALLKRHSILGRMMEEAPLDSQWFASGLSRAQEFGGLLHHLFGVRALGLFGELPGSCSSSYLSGILIGHELASLLSDVKTVYVLGASELSALYTKALEQRGHRAIVLDPDAALRGLVKLADRLGDRSRC
ncbi:MAG TPA: 2-dehydro-3-deoxygalactonokinase [Burkholderiales bacterium]|nr:2-dehydro-3-deoxygalactonokinase [Burkholderiales bacterium]